MSSSSAFDFLYGSYKLYKADTAAVMLHLAQEARSNRVAIPRKANTAADARDENAYLVAVNDIVPFAQCVMAASEKPTPVAILRTLSRAIRSRRRCNAWYQGRTINDASLESSNRSHQHFNNVLDELFDVLAQFYIERNAEGSRERLEVIKGNLDGNLAGNNPFDILELENLNLTDEEDEQVIVEEAKTPKSKPVPKKKSKKGKKPEPPADYQVEKSTDDIRFAMFNMFKDLHQIRQHIHGLLERYVAGDVSLVLIAAVINSAIGIVRSIETKFLKSLPQPQFSSWEDIMSIIASPTQFKAISKGLSDSSELDFLYSIYGLPFQQLQQFRDSLKAGTFPSYPTDRVPFLGPKPSDLVSRLREMTILNEYLQEVALLGRGETLAFEDELTRGIIDICEGRERGSPASKVHAIHLWIVFGLQIFLDTQEQIGPTVTRAFRELTATGGVYRSNIEDHIQYSPDIKKVTYSEEEIQYLRKIIPMSVTKWIDRDRFMELRSLRKTSITGRPFFFLSHNPAVCGIMQCGVLAKSQGEAIPMLVGSTYGTDAAWLYNAVRNEGYLDLQWHDMELLFENHDSAEIFLGGRPKTAKQYHDLFAMSRGLSPISFARDRLPAKGGKMGKKKRDLQPPEIVKTFEKLLCQTDPTKTDISVDLVEQFLHRTAHLQGMRKKKQDALRDHWNIDHTLKPIQLLTLLEECLTEKESMLHFNYYAFYKSCFLLLSSVEAEVHDEFNTYMSEFGSYGNVNECFNHLPAMVFLEFWTQSNKRRGPPPDNILVRVAGAFKKFLEEHAGEPSGKTIGVVDEDNLHTDMEHGAQNGVCIHWGSCERLAPDNWR